MKRQVLFIQGGGERVHDEWDNLLADSLAAALGAGYEFRYPPMPDEDNPAFDKWKSAILNEVAALKDGAILVGHSIGGAILVNALALDPPAAKPRGIFLLSAPFIGEGGWTTDEFEPLTPLGEHLPEDAVVRLYHGSADEEIPPSHMALYAKAIPRAVASTLKGRDHQLSNDLSEVAADIRSLGA